MDGRLPARVLYDNSHTVLSRLHPDGTVREVLDVLPLLAGRLHMERATRAVHRNHLPPTTLTSSTAMGCGRVPTDPRGARSALRPARRPSVCASGRTRAPTGSGESRESRARMGPHGAQSRRRVCARAPQWTIGWISKLRSASEPSGPRRIPPRSGPSDTAWRGQWHPRVDATSRAAPGGAVRRCVWGGARDGAPRGAERTQVDRAAAT